MPSTRSKPRTSGSHTRYARYQEVWPPHKNWASLRAAIIYHGSKYCLLSNTEHYALNREIRIRTDALCEHLEQGLLSAQQDMMTLITDNNLKAKLIRAILVRKTKGVFA